LTLEAPLRPLPLLLLPLGCAACSGGESVGAQGDASLGDDAAVEAGAPTEDSDEDTAEAAAEAAAAACPDGMAHIEWFCVDKWEAYVVELDAQNAEHPHSPYQTVDGLKVRAKTAPSIVPQAYISQVQATAACANAGKRLCSENEFYLACRGLDANNYYPYGSQTKVPGWCNEGKGSMVPLFYGSDPSRWTYADFNDPRLDQVDGGLAKTGSHPHCVSPFGVYDCVGNLHEWGDDPPDSKGHARFRGGFFGDAEINGHGCLYVTSAHEPQYHDYSTGFRCCSSAARQK
jgi:formylglycine-generating enzyme required for sulfatase activity